MNGYKLSARAAEAEVRRSASRSLALVDETRADAVTVPMGGGWSPVNLPVNWWQMGMSPPDPSRSSMVEACVSAYAQTTAMCPGSHWKYAPETGRVRIPNSALARIIKKPNDYQTISDFLLNLVRYLLDNGNAYALVIRNARFEPIELHLMNSDMSHAMIAVDGSVFYALAGNPIIDRRFGPQIVVPARDVLHIKLHTPRHPLLGETPMVAAALEMAAGNAALSHQVNFFLNQSRPSFVLTTDQSITADQVRMLRASWDEQAKGLNSGGTPILGHGLKPSPLGSSNKDAELASILGLSNEAIARVYRVHEEGRRDCAAGYCGQASAGRARDLPYRHRRDYAVTALTLDLVKSFLRYELESVDQDVTLSVALEAGIDWVARTGRSTSRSASPPAVAGRAPIPTSPRPTVPILPLICGRPIRGRRRSG
ncbi:phage portal protein [Sphingomonas sp. T9W2]|uniref:phage portal protein n=1 Tax=Sphingomonas sp. T9W2 TaxID=3143183 RepID=UPI0031F4ED22